MIVYQLTEEQKSAMMDKLKLETFLFPDQFSGTDLEKKAQLDAVDRVHRRFVYVVLTALNGKP